MTSLMRPQAPTSTTNLLLRILERPGLVAAVRELPGPVLGQLIDRIGLEDAGELVALASTQQLERVFDEDLWRAECAGGDETFRPERFALWLKVMLEAGDEAVVRRLCELPEELVALGVHRLVLVIDEDVMEELLRPGDEESEDLQRALDDSAFEEWEEFRLIAREPHAWEDVWNALLLLDRDHHDRLRDILQRCCDMATEFISGQGGLFQVLTSDEMLESDVAAAREDRRGAEGFVSPADARAFLQLARQSDGAGAQQERDAITRAYFRGLATPPASSNAATAHAGALPSLERGSQAVASGEARELAALLHEGELSTPAGAGVPLLAALGKAPSKAGESRQVAPIFERALSDLRRRDPDRFADRVREVGYLVNVWIAGGSAEGRRPRPVEALEVVLATCEAGMKAQAGPSPATAAEALATLVQWPADMLFRRGLRGAGGAK